MIARRHVRFSFTNAVFLIPSYDCLFALVEKLLSACEIGICVKGEV